MDHICHTSRKMSHLSSITLFLQDAEWRIAENLSFAISCNKSLSFSFFLSRSSSSLSFWLSFSLSLSLSPSVFVSLFLLLSRSFSQTHFMFPPSLFVRFLSHSLLSPSVTYFPLLSFVSLSLSHSSTNIVRELRCARVVRERESA